MHLGQLPNARDLLRTVRPESYTTLKYLSRVLPNHPDSDSRGHGQRTHFARHQFDYTCGIVATTFAAPVDADRSTLTARARFGVPYEEKSLSLFRS